MSGKKYLGTARKYACNQNGHQDEEMGGDGNAQL